MIPGWSSNASDARPVPFPLPVDHVILYRDSRIFGKPSQAIGRIVGQAEVTMLDYGYRELAVEIRFRNAFDVALVDRIE